MRRILFLLAPVSVVGLLACVGDSAVSSPVDSGDGGSADGATTSNGDGGITPTDGGGSTPVDASSCKAPETQCGTSCVNVASDDANCGACGHSCGGDGCSAGLCKPANLLDGLTFPTALAANDVVGQVFVVANATVLKCAKTGCGNAGTPLWTGATYVTKDTSALALGATGMGATVYKAGTSTQAYVNPSINGVAGDPTAYTPPGTLTHLAADMSPGSSLIVAQEDYGVYTCQSGYCQSASAGTIKYAGEDGENAIAVQAGAPGYLVWPTYNNIHYCKIGSATTTTPCSPTNLITTTLGTQPLDVTVSGKNAYFKYQNGATYQVFGCAFPSGCSAPTLLVDGETAMDGFAADDVGIYWTDKQNGTLRACLDTVKGCGSKSIVLTQNLTQPYAIALDKSHVFFTQRGGTAGQGKLTRIFR
jgi:hypothetical protein